MSAFASAYDGIVLVHLILCDLQDEEMFLAEPLEMADVLFSDDMAFSKGAALELSGPDLGDVMGETVPTACCTGMVLQ